MGDETTIEGEVTELPAEVKQYIPQAAAARAGAAATATAAAVKDAFGSVGKAVTSAFSDRDHMVTVRVSHDVLRHLDMLVQAEVTKSRSESAAVMINEGIKANKTLFERIGTTSEQIATLRSQLRQAVVSEPGERKE
jgi:hypothetical protein